MLKTEKEIRDALASKEFRVDFADMYKKSKVLAAFVDNTWREKFANQIHKKYFKRADLPLTETTKGSALYEVSDMVVSTPTQAYARAKYSDLPSDDFDGMETRTGSISDFGSSYHLTGKEKQAYDKLKEELGNDMMLFNLYITKVSDKILSHHLRLNNMAMQKMSYTRFTTTGGFGGEYDIARTTPYEVDAEHRDMPAGDKIWADTTAPIIDYIKTYVKKFRDDTSYAGPVTLKMERDVYEDIFLKNDQVKEMVQNYMAAQGLVLPNGFLVTEETYDKWNSAAGGSAGTYLPPIEIIEEESMIQGVNGKTPVKGWKPGIVVLSPAGYQGETFWAKSTENNLLNGIADYAIADLDGGLLQISNRVRVDGDLPIWTTKVLGTYEPVLNEFLHHWCINTAKAGSITG